GVTGREGTAMLSVNYGRISRKEAKNQTVESIEGQLAECEDDALAEDDSTIPNLKDKLTASDFKLKDRPIYLKLVSMVRANEVEIIRVTEQSRLDRELWNVLELIERSRTTKLQAIRLVREGVTLDLSTEASVNRIIDQANR